MNHELKDENYKEIVNEQQESMEPMLSQNNESDGTSSQSLVILYFNNILHHKHIKINNKT